MINDTQEHDENSKFVESINNANEFKRVPN